MKRIGVFLIVVVVIAATVAYIHRTPPYEPEIRDWHDLHAVRYHLGKSYVLMNDLDATTAGYEELASPTANRGKGWEPIGTLDRQFSGTLDGQGYEISDLFIDRPDESRVGLFGAVWVGLIEHVGVVNASVTGKRMVGGLVGDSSKTTVSKSYFSGNVTGSEIVGGLVGGNFLFYVEDSYSAGSVSGDEYVGGLVGENRGLVSDSYATVSVSGYSYVGGLVGWNAGATVRNSFWDVETSGMDESDGGTGKTTAEMMDIATFTDTETEGLDEPWDMVTVAAGDTNPACAWNIVDGQTYPFLSWHPATQLLVLFSRSQKPGRYV